MRVSLLMKYLREALKGMFSTSISEVGQPGGFIRPFHSKIMAISRAVDNLGVVACLWLSTIILGIPWEARHAWASVIGLIIFQFVAEYNEVYRVWRGLPVWRESLRILGSWIIAGMLLLLIGYMPWHTAYYRMDEMGVWFVLTPLGLIFLHATRRLLLRLVRSQKGNSRRVAILGVRPLGKKVEQAIKSMPWMGYRFVGYYDDRAAADGRRLDDLNVKVCGGFNDLVKHAREGKVDTVYVVLPMSAEKRISELVTKLADSTVSVYIVPDFFMFSLLHARWTTLQGLPTVSIYESPFYGVDGITKRIEDIILSSMILTIIAIPMLVIALGVKLTSPGPVIFKQRRYGIGGEQIEVWKFRTMYVCENNDKVVQATKGDSRITPFGAFLRRTSLDEFPQFINVLQGTMSVVGPRPHAVAHNEEYRSLIQGYMLRHKVKPGITGWAQVNGFRGETETLDKMEQRVKYDLDYIRYWSLFLDIKITFLTVFKGFIGKNVY